MRWWVGRFLMWSSAAVVVFAIGLAVVMISGMFGP